MPDTDPRILITGATGQLGRLVVESLLKRAKPSQIVAGVRSSAAAKDLAALGVEIREADYEKPPTLATAFQGIDRLLLISSNDLDRRLPQHRNAIEAAKETGVKLIVYTGLLRGESSPLGLKSDHVATEALLRASGLPFSVLRNGWYSENFSGFIPSALEHGALFGSAGSGRIASAARADFAEAAAVVLTLDEARRQAVYELAGDEAYTKAEWAAELSRQSGKPVEYKDLPEADYRALLVKVGLPEPLAAMLADSDVGTSKGGLYDDSHTLSTLISRPTTPLKDVLAAALKQ